MDFDRQGRATFIEFLAGVDGKIQPQIYGVAAFQTETDSLYELLKSKNNGEVDDGENGYSYSFLISNIVCHIMNGIEDISEITTSYNIKVENAFDKFP